MNTPKLDPVAECIEYLRSHGDYFGVNLLKAMQVNRVGQENPEEVERTREEEG